MLKYTELNNPPPSRLQETRNCCIALCVSVQSRGGKSALTFIHFHLVGDFERKNNALAGQSPAFINRYGRYRQNEAAVMSSRQTKPRPGALRRSVCCCPCSTQTASQFVQIRSSSKVAAARSASRRR